MRNFLLRSVHVHKVLLYFALVLFFISIPVTVTPVSGFAYSTAHAATQASADIGNLSEPCRDSGKCEGQDLGLLSRLVIACGSSANDDGSLCTSEEAQVVARIEDLYKNVTASPNSCGYFWDWVGYTCFLRLASVLIGTALIGITAWLLAVAGLLFNVLVDHTIVTFGYLFTEKVGTAISTAWGAFRDVANIVIIGMFVFTAINIILGVKEFGQKKMIAKILIIAVLINFSLLFTKMITDASNFTAMQFYKASALSADAAASQGLNFTEFSKKGISGRFIDLMGVRSLAETSAAISAGAFGNASTNYQNANGWMALLQGLVSAILLLAAALVLFYGCYLLASRAILLILLMLTSALAFASWLIPYHIVEQGWSTWWRTLLKTALLAPILMIFLWATLLVATAVTPAGGALGSLAAKPNSTLDLNALFSYVIVIGLLFASFKASSAFSHSISGFGSAAGALTGSLGIPLALGGRLAGFAGRNIIARGAARFGKGVGDDVNKTREMLTKVPKGVNFNKRREFLTNRLQNLEATKKSADWVAKRSFSLAGTGVGKDLLKRMGVPSLISGGKAESFGDRAKRVSDDAAKRAAEVTALSEKQKDAIRREAGERIEAEHRVEKTRLKGVEETARKEHEVSEGKRGTEKPGHEEREKEAMQQVKKIEKEIERLEEDKDHEKPGTDTHKDYIAAKGRLKVQDEIIKNARTAVQNLEETAATKKQAFNVAQKAIEKHDDSLESRKKEAGEQALEKATANLQEVAKTLAPRIASGRATRIFSLGMNPDNSHISQLAREKVVPRIKSAEYRKGLLERKALDKELGDADESKGGGTLAPESPKKT